ncbi:uncharacterized protein LOC111106212 isoform X2 [Crassostrea virginica]
MKLAGVIIVLVHTVCALTSIQVQNSTIQLGKTDVDIRCLVNDSENESIRETKKNDTNDVCGYKPSQHSFLLVLLAMLINYNGMLRYK